MAHHHTHVGSAPHSHDHGEFNAAEHGHSHEILDGPGSFMGREMPLIEGRDWTDRAFTIGIGGYAFNSVMRLDISPLRVKEHWYLEILQDQS